METRTNADVVKELAIATSPAEAVDGSHYVIVPSGCQLQSLEHLQGAPSRTKGTVNFASVAAACRYINDFKDEWSRVFMKVGGAFECVLDYPTEEHPRWGQHKAAYGPVYSEPWKVWLAAHKRPMNQRAFAEFVEENLSEFFAPAGAEMLDLARTLEAKKSVAFKSGIRLENGDVSLAFEETTAARAGVKGELEIPSQFTIRLPVLLDEEARTVECRLKYAINDGAVVFSVEVIRLGALLEEVGRSIYATVKNETGIEPLMVA
jgi:uncharacterized protein YfdQ (DUF2303 family)